jgi:hypothetical protein
VIGITQSSPERGGFHQPKDRWDEQLGRARRTRDARFNVPTPFLSERAFACYLTDHGVSVRHETVRQWVKRDIVEHITLPSGRARIAVSVADALLAGRPEHAD